MIDNDEINEIDDKAIVNLIIESKSFFENVDENFYDGVQKLIKLTYESLKKEGLFKRYKKYKYEEWNDIMTYGKNEFERIEIPDRKYIKPINSPNETYRIVEDFYYSLGKMYGEIAHHFLGLTPATITDRALCDDDYIFRFLRYEDNITLEDSSDFMYAIEGNYLDAIIISHEIAHQLTDYPNTLKQIEVKKCSGHGNDEEKNMNASLEMIEQSERNFINNSAFSETTAMYMELICADYIKEKYGVDEYAKWAMTIRGTELLDDLKNNNLNTLSEWLKLVKEIGTENSDILRVKDFIKEHEIYFNYKNDNELMSTFLVLEYQHLLGYFYAIFLKNKNGVLETKEILDKCIKINSFGTGFNDEEIEILNQLQLPIVKDDKIVMDEKAIIELSASFLKYFRENLKRGQSPKNDNNFPKSNCQPDDDYER